MTINPWILFIAWLAKDLINDAYEDGKRDAYDEAFGDGERVGWERGRHYERGVSQ